MNRTGVFTKVLAVVSLAASLGLAQVTGLASGEAEPGGWRMVLVVGLLAGYTLALVGVGVAGALLVRDVFKRGGEGTAP
jgi:hypothetical protein